MIMYDDIAQRYIDAWNQTDPTARRAAMDELYTEDARYVDPLSVAEGKAAITATIGAVQRFRWELGPAGEPAPIVGFDVAVTDNEGRIQTVFGFLDKVPATT
jgi:hypothetical protein